jgi:hypothetical protein
MSTATAPATSPASRLIPDLGRPADAKTIRQAIFEAIAAVPGRGLTDEEIQEELDLPGNTQRPRRGELVAQGRIVKFGSRPTKTGRHAAVWVALEVPVIPKKQSAPPKAITVRQCRGEDRQIRTFKSFVTVEGNTQIITLPQTFQILSGDTLTFG